MPGLAPVGSQFTCESTTGAKPADDRQDSVRREKASQESRVALPRRSIYTPKTADTSAESRQSELVFFLGGGIVHLVWLSGARGCPRSTPWILHVH